MTKEELDQLMKDAIKQIHDELVIVYDAKLQTTLKPHIEQLEKTKGDFETQLADLKKPVVSSLGAVSDTGDKKAGFPTFTEFITDVRDAAVGRVSDKLGKIMDMERKAAGSSLNIGSAEFGGYLVPEEYRAELLKVAVERSDILQKVTMVPMGTNAIAIPAVSGQDRSGGTVYGGISFSWIDEEAGVTETRPKFELVNLRLKKMMAMYYMSSELMQFSPISVESVVRTLFGEALGWFLDDVFLTGNGSAKPLGILSAGCRIAQAVESGQTTTDPILYENITNMYMHQWRKSNSSWYINPEMYPELAKMVLTIGTAGAGAFLPAMGASVSPYNTLMGRPVMESEHLSAKNTEGDIVSADWSQYLVGYPQAAGMQPRFDTSIHLKFDYDQTAFRIIMHLDGQPWWRTYVTPHRGSATLSPFVTLATRT